MGNCKFYKSVTCYVTQYFIYNSMFAQNRGEFCWLIAMVINTTSLLLIGNWLTGKGLPLSPYLIQTPRDRSSRRLYSGPTPAFFFLRVYNSLNNLIHNYQWLGAEGMLSNRAPVLYAEIPRRSPQKHQLKVLGWTVLGKTFTWDPGEPAISHSNDLGGPIVQPSRRWLFHLFIILIPQNIENSDIHWTDNTKKQWIKALYLSQQMWDHFSITAVFRRLLLSVYAKNWKPKQLLNVIYID